MSYLSSSVHNSMQPSKLMSGHARASAPKREGREVHALRSDAWRGVCSAQKHVSSQGLSGKRKKYLNALARESGLSFSEKMEKAAQLWFDAETQERPQIENIVHSDCIFTDKMNGWAFRGWDDIRKRMTDFNSAYPDFELSVLDIMTNSARKSAACHWAGTGTNLGCIAECGPTGVRCRLSGVHLFTFNEDGIIIDVLAYREKLEEECKFIY